MSRVRSKNTTPELMVRRALFRMGYRFRLHKADLPGSPDIVLKALKCAMFVHGCFWHGHRGCPRAARPTSNIMFWERKLDRNIVRDRNVREELRVRGWRAVVLWECQLRDEAEIEARLRKLIARSAGRIEGTSDS